MYLSRFGVKNYKCLGEIDIPLTPIHVLIGQNDCGKTSLLEAMAAFFATSKRDWRRYSRNLGRTRIGSARKLGIADRAVG